MENTKELTKWMFQEELKAMAVSCIGNKENTAKVKAAKLFAKYQDLIEYSVDSKNYNNREHLECVKRFRTLKAGVIEYTRGEKCDGKILIEDIIAIESREDSVLLTLKSGKEITMGKDFKYLIDVI